MRMQVFHATAPTVGLAAFGWASAPHWPAEYALAAEVVVCGRTLEERLEHAFAQTQHHVQLWWHHPGVTRLGDACRSTSVGDVIVCGDGTAYRCDPEGWTRTDHHVMVDHTGRATRKHG